jgi:D-3-phosphoglycerate dehydrogenase
MVNQILIAAPISNTLKEALLSKGYNLVDEHCLELNTIVGIITSNKLQLNATTLPNYPNLKWIARLGSGMEIIDTVYCDQHNIRYFSSPKGIANAVAEHTTGMLLSLLHRIPSSFAEIQQQKWIREPNRGVELEHKIVGIIGYGHTGSAFASKLKAFNTSILAYDKNKSGFGDDIIEESSLERIQAEADIISFHVPLNAETRHYYNQTFLNQTKKNHILINVSRGAVCDTTVILQGLQSGQIHGACLDVLEEEKNIHDILLQVDNIIERILHHNVILTPHIAGYSMNAIEKMSMELWLQLNEII